MAQDLINNDLYVNGGLSARTFNPPAGSITNAAVLTAAGVEATKLQHQHQPVYAQPGGSASAAERKVLHVVRGATATIVGVAAGSRTKCTGNATITVDVLKNGTTVLSSTIVLDSSNADYTPETGTVSVTSAVQNDVLEVNVTVNAGTGALGNGVYVVLNVREDAQ